MKKQSNLVEIMRGAEKAVERKQIAAHSKQSFSGVLKVEVDKVFVGKKDGARALQFLRDTRTVKGR